MTLTLMLMLMLMPMLMNVSPHLCNDTKGDITKPKRYPTGHDTLTRGLGEAVETWRRPLNQYVIW